ncbi:RNA polymerase sigma factor [Paenibacillus flagellatus]|uniref:RNA polymerase sigma factor n=1 Tax=Paenibacillus flagellatus TaxID=2211139 RepID=UPI001FE7999E|nr:sigma-70 family RNA polymerase sigma factor [Paenibacillus flagellatus]
MLERHNKGGTLPKEGRGAVDLENILLLLTSSNFSALDITIQRSVYREFYTLVYRVVIQMVKDHAATEDIIQEAFLKVIRNVPIVDNETQLKSWLKVVVRNTTYNYIRKNKKNCNQIDSDNVFLDNNIAYATDAEMIEDHIEMKMMADMIGRYLQDLKPEFRCLIEMRWKNCMSYKEIAEELHTSEDSIKYKLHRARNSIKKRFIKEWGESK